MKNHPNRSRVKDWPAYIRRFRERHGLTQKRLSEALGIPVRAVEGWEQAEFKPPPYLELALAQIAAKLSRESEGQNASAGSESKGAQ